VSAAHGYRSELERRSQREWIPLFRTAVKRRRPESVLALYG
jgi:hypothetical protein